ncbi:hypothetical protein L249_1718 [Ophiocordyceps polyrhachis-furcata BCC 54312]|uniref:FAD/NAD(P)-binding domain-containing protein n=1 Tax=Ophiocordyceps polyrhachis-furcata BCC 54312 TaxID=1330021 RepID=A0A367LQN6_9HYPO|nr:hypothetical protein L249_1718 [Ophiocordyceps polyrhachis-furcata BCC 54312]
MAEPPAFSLPLAVFPSASPPPETVRPEHEAEALLKTLNRALSQADYRAAANLFTDQGFWRDHLALSWRFRTLKGRDGICKFLEECAKSRDGFRIKSFSLDSGSPSRKPHVAPVDAVGKVVGIHAFFLFETAIGSGEGLMRLLLQHGQWAIFTFYTSLRELRGHEELTFDRRPVGVDHGEHLCRKNWSEKRRLEGEVGQDNNLSVLIVGAGQGGLTAAARLKMLGLDALIIDQNDRVGDNWRKRYHHLVLHDAVWYDHMPYIPFPPNWPIFTPKDKLAQFFEAYAMLLELNVWMKTTVKSCKWDEHRKRWSVTVSRVMDDGSTQARTLHPRHIIQATGHSGLKYQPEIKGSDSFKGDVFCHSSEFAGARKGTSGKRAVVVGCCNSGHDIAQDYFENGYDVTMIQRSGTIVVSSSSVTDVILNPLFTEGGPPVEDGDLNLHGTPISVFKAIQKEKTQICRRNDLETLTALDRAGFKLSYGPQDTGFYMAYLESGGGYYIDVGASKLISDGKIKIKQGHEVAEILPHGVRLADGSELEADEIILATGYQNMKSHTKQIFGSHVSDRVNDVWGVNSEGEMRTIWQDSGHPGFWFHGSNLGMCRYFSRLLALQIKGLEEGLYKYGDM